MINLLGLAVYQLPTLESHDVGHGQNAFLGTPAQGFGMLGRVGSGSITVRVCLG